MSNKFYVTTPIYYVNDKPHIGHAYTTIASDVLARYNRLLGKDVFFITGTDEHGAKILEAAEKNGKSPKEFCDEKSNLFREAWKNLNISHDFFIRTTDERHVRLASIFLQKLFDKGYIYKGTYKGLYCIGCESYKTESDLVDGLCPDHKKEPQLLEEENYFFKLSEFNDSLKQKIESGEILVNPESRKNEVLGWLKEGLQDIAISRKDLKWGIPMPFDESQTAYVWIEALMNYVTAHDIFENEENFNKWWPADIHIMAKDIVKFHALIWPAMLMAIDLECPKQVFAHGFFTIDGQKMSKTIGNVIDPNEVTEKYGADAVRYFLLSEFSFGQDGDISVGRLEERYQADLANGIGNLVSRVFSMVSKQGELELDYSNDSEFRELTEKTWKDYHEKISSLKFHEVLEGVRYYMSFCDKYVEQNKPWELAKTDQDRLKQVLTNLVESVYHIALMVQPIMPEVADKILKGLKIQDVNYSQIKWGTLNGKVELEKISPLFPRLD